MRSPEILLQDMNAALRDLHGAAQLLEDERLKVDLPLIMRRLLLAEVLGNTSIFAIGGSQGAGKTTLVCCLYALDDKDVKWLQPNEGRGEKLPILVVEDAAHTQVQGAVRRLREVNGQYSVFEDEVDVGAFQTAICDPATDILLPVLKVPQRYFSRPNQAWLLLPGYEAQDRQNKDWQELMRQALIGSSACIVVTDETRMANQEQVKIVNDMLSNELRDKQALVVISKTEAARNKSERLQELRATAGQVFGVSADPSSNRVICIGADDSAYVAEWLPILRKAIDDLSRSRGADRKAQLTQLEDVLGRQLSKVLTLISNKSKLYFQARDDGDGAQEVMQHYLEVFSEASDELREKYNQEISTMLNAQFDEAWKVLQQKLIDEHEGLWNNVGNWFSTASKSRQLIEGNVSEAWGKPAELLKHHANVIGKLTQNELGAPPSVKNGLNLDSGSVLQKLGYVNSERLPIQWERPNNADQQNLKVILGGRSLANSSDSPVRVSSDAERALKILPALTLEYARLASMMPAIVGESLAPSAPTDAAHQENLVKEAVQQFGKGIDLGKTVLQSIAGLLLVDLSTDGDIDMLTVFNGAVLPTAGGAAIGGIGAAVVGFVAVGFLAHSAISATRQYDEKARLVALDMLMNCKEQYSRHFQHHFKLLMDQMRSKLRNSLRERYRLDEILMQKDRLAKALADTRAIQRDLLDAIARSGSTISLFNTDTTL